MMLATELIESSTILFCTKPEYPEYTPKTWMFEVRAVRTTERMAAFMPGASPPLVSTAIFLSGAFDILVPLYRPKNKKDQSFDWSFFLANQKLKDLSELGF
jgi:hypothetical protein